MIRRIAKLLFYIKAPLQAFVVFHPVKAAKLWLAYVLGSALFGARKRAERDGAAASSWGEAKAVQGSSRSSAEAGATQARTDGGNGAAPSARNPAANDAVAAASIPEGNQAS